MSQSEANIEVDRLYIVHMYYANNGQCGEVQDYRDHGFATCIARDESRVRDWLCKEHKDFMDDVESEYTIVESLPCLADNVEDVSDLKLYVAHMYTVDSLDSTNDYKCYRLTTCMALDKYSAKDWAYNQLNNTMKMVATIDTHETYSLTLD